MIKDNHRDFAGGIRPAYERLMEYLQKNSLNLPVEIETRNLKDVQDVLDLPGPVQRIMFDNFQPNQVREALTLVQGRMETEASGGITEANLLYYAETGVDFISMGALTHSVRSIDISMKAYLP
jgi:nicotinate-nucleotide pyrophosphorylase (carboxylating)